MPKNADKSDRPYIEKDLALSGRLITDLDGTLIGESDFQELVNLRYTNSNPRGIAGMTIVSGAPPSFSEPE